MTVCCTYPCQRTAAGCPACDARIPYTLPTQPPFTPMGCICPPTSEKTCQNPVCPRKGIKIGGGQR
jgi:hypothetical protein